LTNSNGQGGMLAGSSSPVIPRQRQVLGSPNPNGQGGEFVDSPNPHEISALSMGSAGNESVLTVLTVCFESQLGEMEEFIQKSLLETFVISDEGHDAYYFVSKASYRDYCTRNGIEQSLSEIVNIAALPEQQLHEQQAAGASSSLALRSFSQSDHVIFILEEFEIIRKDADKDFKKYILKEVSYDNHRKKFKLDKDSIQASWLKLVDANDGGKDEIEVVLKNIRDSFKWANTRALIVNQGVIYDKNAAIKLSFSNAVRDVYSSINADNYYQTFASILIQTYSKEVDGSDKEEKLGVLEAVTNKYDEYFENYKQILEGSDIKVAYDASSVKNAFDKEVDTLEEVINSTTTGQPPGRVV
jgi:hypothetical protein